MCHKNFLTKLRDKLPLLLLAPALLLAFLTNAGCNQKSSSPPPVADSTFVSLLAELHLLEARQTTTGKLPAALRDSVFDRYNVDSTAYEQTVAYYSRHVEEYAELYNQVVDRLLQQQDTLSNSLRRPTSEKDSSK